MKNKLSVLAFLASIMLFATTFISLDEAAAAGFREKGVHHDEGIACKDCHKVEKPKDAPSHKACLECHGPYEKMAERTKKLEINPHDSHLGPIECLQCHGVHEPLEMKDVPCLECHSEFKFKMK